MQIHITLQSLKRIRGSGKLLAKPNEEISLRSTRRTSEWGQLHEILQCRFRWTSTGFDLDLVLKYNPQHLNKVITSWLAVCRFKYIYRIYTVETVSSNIAVKQQKYSEPQLPLELCCIFCLMVYWKTPFGGWKPQCIQRKIDICLI